MSVFTVQTVLKSSDNNKHYQPHAYLHLTLDKDRNKSREKERKPKQQQQQHKMISYF